MKTTPLYTLEIHDPSGELRRVPLNGSLSRGFKLSNGPGLANRAEDSEDVATVRLKDPTLPPFLGTVALEEGAGAPLWLKLDPVAPPARLSDLEVREARLPAALTLKLGETTLTLRTEVGGADQPAQPSGVQPWITASESGRKLLWMAKKAAPTPLSIYIGGETGTGKEVIANLLHAWSDRASGPFVPINCGALPSSLAESELFGHVKGAFTGATHQRPGALLQAHGGTVFLDEVGDLPLDIQVKLLRFLENGELRPVGADRPTRADVRVLCATHLPLRQLVEEGKFRRDLYYRIASVTLEIPPLRARPRDIELLSERFAGSIGKSLSPRARLRLQAHAWPGNVRELRHAVERASGLAGPFTPVLDEEAFSFLVSPESIERAPEIELGSGILTLEEMERVMLLKSLRLSSGNRARAARILGVARSTLFEMLKRHKIPGPKAANGGWEA